jgi:hypothetical protein
VVSPKLTKVSDKPGSAYLAEFSREKTPLEKLFSGTKLFVLPKAQNIGAVPSAEAQFLKAVLPVANDPEKRDVWVEQNVNGTAVEAMVASSTEKVEDATFQIDTNIPGEGPKTLAVKPARFNLKKVLLYSAFLLFLSLIALPFLQNLMVLHVLPPIVEPLGFNWMGVFAGGLNLALWFVYFTGTVSSVLVLVTFLARAFGQTAWGEILCKAIYAKVKVYEENTDEIRKVSKIKAALRHLPIGLTKTMYGFGFERIDNLLKLYEGQDLPEKNWVETNFGRAPPIFQLLLLPLAATLSILSKRLVLKFLSLLSQKFLIAVISITVLGLASMFGFDSLGTAGIISSILNWNFLDPLMTGWLDPYLQGGGITGAFFSAVFSVWNFQLICIELFDRPVSASP